MDNNIGLYRGKRTDNNQWVTGNLLIDSNGKHYIANAYDSKNLNLCEVNPDTVGRYTTIKDKNNTKVFSGDILKTKSSRLCEVYWFSSPSFCGWDLKPVNTWMNINDFVGPTPYDLYLPDNLEVMGNIYDNPDLFRE